MKRIGFTALLILFVFPELFPQPTNSNPIRDSIKVFISEVVYERMEFWGTESERDSSSLNEIERNGLVEFKNKFKGKSNWDKDSISTLLHRYNWKFCETQVFIPLVEMLEKQEENKNYDFQSFLNVNVGDNFRSSSNYIDLIAKYTLPQQSVKLNSEIITESENSETRNQFSNKNKTSRSILNRITYSPFKTFLWGSLILGIIVIFVVKIQKHRYQRRKKKVVKPGTNKPFSDQNLSSQNLNLQKEKSKLENENRELKRRIEELERNKKQTESEELSSKGFEKEGPETNQPTSQDAGITVQHSQETIEYYDSHENGVFNKSRSTNENDRRAIFKIKVSNARGNLYLLTGPMDPMLIANKDLFLEDVCDIINLPGGSADKIIVDKPGEVELQNDTWVINTKIQISIQ